MFIAALCASRMDGYREHRLLTYAHAALPPLLTSPRWGEAPDSLPPAGGGLGRGAVTLPAETRRGRAARAPRRCSSGVVRRSRRDG